MGKLSEAENSVKEDGWLSNDDVKSALGVKKWSLHMYLTNAMTDYNGLFNAVRCNFFFYWIFYKLI